MRSIPILLFVLTSLSTFAQEEWQLKKDKSGVKVYTKRVDGWGLKAIKATTTFACDLATCVAVLRDIPHLTELFPDCEKTEKVTQTDVDQIHYLHLNAPWPVTDRDATFHLTYEYRPESESVFIQADVINEKYPEQDGMVRLTKGIGTWTFTKAGEKTELIYRFNGEAGGNIPDWLANSVVEDNPLEMLQNYHELVNLPRYQGKSFTFLNP
ncbi:MAG: hypothetical protein ACI85F_002209 [Bacteroidia bacterium]|jgi:hypothetical protein